MRKKIDFPPYSEAEVIQIVKDGSVLCNLYGGKITDERGLEKWNYTDSGILFPPDSEILSLTDDERRQIEEEYNRYEMTLAELEAERVAQREEVESLHVHDA